MDKSMVLNLLVFTILLTLLCPKTDCYWPPHRPTPTEDPFTSFCNTQFQLANRACALVTFSSVGLPHHHHRHRHHHGHGHHHNHHDHDKQEVHQHLMHTETENALVEEECCRWLKEVDNDCACSVFVHLPTFLAKPPHNYSLVVNDECEVSFQCSPRLA
ncbi:AAA ATPase containing von Willebrand factor typeA [Striga asiatica]|uniref:AAA ATPase containing von Willebrand factor typeA n=1 Tax=Striga asiatica TaxID=4170 RepID=A0A5A7Q2I2_STRAF|nr:AAA ATPase containing von Willebrand factor typeA [Striga asiatica]